MSSAEHVACDASVRRPASAVLLRCKRSPRYKCHLRLISVQDRSPEPSFSRMQPPETHESGRRRDERSNILTALENHLPPPSSNQLRWPPSEVVHNTAYGLCLTSALGRASFTAISMWSVLLLRERMAPLTGSSSAWIARNGIRIASRESVDGASR